ncbi:unnamed protein product [Rhizoctonia solani]|uniref:C2H2-type domain-containing protein n=1 Tax=Rhizoctonia solani TaxID=456999 RepID=A0A8H3BKY4_9AGAM|nr:unnamed protein product [Rhizoctonia solani]
MCVTQPEACEDKATTGRIKSECGESEIVGLGANTEQEDSEPPTPKKRTAVLPKLIKEENDEDDPLTSLARLFGYVSIDAPESFDDSEDDSDDESVPGSPRPKGISKYCFYASGRLYYFDDYRNLYLEDGTFVSSGSMNFQTDDLLTPSFYIEGVAYWFDLNGLLYQGIDGTVDRVHIWQSDPEPFNLGQVFDVTTFQTDLALLSPKTPDLYYDIVSSPAAASVSSRDCSTPKTKSEVSSPNSQSLYQTLQGHLAWSPSMHGSPLVAAASREASPLFDSQPGLISGIPIVTKACSPIVAKWHQDTAQAQKDAATARPSRKPSKEERRRCPICNKMFRRPSSLDDHLNVHSGDKPHTCPFTGCNTGFATKSNMKRHFLTHRVGQLEHYRPGLTPSDVQQPSLTKSGKSVRAPTSTYNSRAHHTLRFRIAA